MYKPTTKLFLAASVLILLNFSSCTKYEDGPQWSFKSAKARLVGDWEVVRVNGEDNALLPQWSDLDDFDIEMEFEEDGDFEMKVEGTYTYTWYNYYNGETYEWTWEIDIQQQGEWEFEDGKQTIEIDINQGGWYGSSVSEEMEIKRLSEDELWFEDENGVEWELEKQ